VRIGILTQWYDPEPGSAAIPGVLARSLAARGHSVQVVTGFPNYPTGKVMSGYRLARYMDEETENGVAVRRVALYPSHDGSSWHRFTNYGSFALSATTSALGLLRNLDSLWVYNSPATIGLPSWLTSTSGGPPHLMHVLDLWPDSIEFSGLARGRSYAVIAPVLERWCRFTYERAASIACISVGVLDELTARGVPRAKLHHVPVWTDETRYHPRPRDHELARALGVDDAFVLLYAGNLGYTQGLDTLLETCAQLKDLVGFHCLVAGSGTAEEGLRARAASLSLRNVTFLGRWPADEMGALMSIGDLHLVSLNDHPLASMTLPSKLVATLASGRPVLAAATGETARVVRDADAGWSVAPGDSNGLVDSLRHAHAVGRGGTDRLGVAARRYYERELSTERGVDTIETLLVKMASSIPRLRAMG
jgi:colanic acid biosynthesis glycosyl transferase WcaI